MPGRKHQKAEEKCGERITKGKNVKVIDKVKQMDSKELAKWICNEVMNDDCDNCPLTRRCDWHQDVIAKMLEKEIPVKKSQHCIPCEKVLDPNCKGNGKETCLNYVPRKSNE